ncbi:MAG: hypothetical protein M3Y87_18645 [Myxococcota bacterium]|nr:hypothetical protein [Myxococcota bacterium]
MRAGVRWWAAVAVNAVASVGLGLAIAAVIDGLLVGRLDRDHVARAALSLWLPLLALGGLVRGAPWAGALVLGAALSLVGVAWPIPVLLALSVAVIVADAWRHGRDVEHVVRFTVTWAAAGFLGAVVADGMHFDLVMLDGALAHPVIASRVALELTSALCIVLLLLGGRTAALLALVLSALLLVTHTQLAPARMIASNGGCLSFAHVLWPGSGLSTEAAIAAVIALVPWVGPARRALVRTRAAP